MIEEHIARIIRNIRITISNLQLYPKESALVKDTINITFESINEILKTINSIVLSEADKNILVNGKKIDFKGADKASETALVETFIQHDIKSITISVGITLNETADFLEGLSRKKKSKEDTVSNLIKDKNITHITVNEKIYVAVGHKDRVLTQHEGRVLTQHEDKVGGTGSGDGIGIGTGEGIGTGTGSGEGIGIGVGAGEGIGVGTGQGVIGGVPTQSKVEKLIEKTQNLLGKDDVELLKTDVKEIKETLKDLDNAERCDLAGSVVDKLALNLESTADNVRLKTVKAFKDALPVVESLSDKKIFEEIQGKFVVTEDKETNEQVYSELAELLEYGVDKFLKEGNYIKTIEIVGMFRRHNITKGEGFLKRWEIAETVLSKIANPYIIDILISDLKSENENRKNQAYTVVMKLQNAAVPGLIEAIKQTEDIHMRKVLAFAIRNMDVNGTEKLVDELDNNTSPEIAKRIIDVLDGIGGSKVIVNKLQNAFKHYNPMVRKEIMRTFSKLSTPESLENGFISFD